MTAKTSQHATISQPKPTLFYLSVFTIVIAIIVCLYCMGNSSSEMASPVVVPIRKGAAHKATLIFLHGLGDTGHGWADAFKELSLSTIRCIFPTAPVQPVTVNGGMRMPSWFDIQGLAPDVEQDAAGIKSASKNLKDLIEQERKSNADAKILIGGFSQGGAVAIYTALTSGIPLSGVVGLSTWVPLHKEIESSITGDLKNLPIFQGHGTLDPLVPFQWAQLSGTKLSTISQKHTFKTYENMMHSSCSQEMEDVKQFLLKITESE